MLVNNQSLEQLCQAIHADLAHALTDVYAVHGLVMTQLVREAESQEYAACTFKLNELHVVFRAAHITPTKVGQFVTLWKRSSNGPIRPFEATDSIDVVVISVRSGNRCGQFVFPRVLLVEQGVFARTATDGKRALRIYPPWDVTDSRQAQRSQAWQCRYFVDLSNPAAVDRERVQQLYLI
jgi:hypothetical protein